MSNQDLTYNQFVAFLLLFAANADLEITADEVAHIKERVGSEDYAFSHVIFEQQNDTEVIATIMGYKEKYYPSNGERDNLLSEISAVFASDNDYSSLEKEVMMVIRKLL